MSSSPIYIFGYGSLVNPTSRARTLGQTAAVTARVLGFQRAWCARGCGVKMTTLGIAPKLGAVCNGVLVPVAPELLPELDKRERGYARVQIGDDAVEAEGRARHAVYSYVIQAPTPPDDEHPIAQTYLDVALSGFLRLGRSHAEEFLTTTHGWQGPHFDDRQAPRYHAAEREHPVEELDALVRAILPSPLR